MKITILTVCPEEFAGFLHSHVVCRAVKEGLAEVAVADIRDYVKGSFRDVDDSPYGGGAGMVLRADALYAAWEKVRTPSSHTVILSPRGRVYDQAKAYELSSKEDLVLVCGHYEGIDERFYPCADELVSLGDFIVTGGELPAMVVADSVLRLLKGNLKVQSLEEESFTDGLLEYPQYTRPFDFRGNTVPEVLLSGDHEAVRRYRKEEARRITEQYRPDLLKEK